MEYSDEHHAHFEEHGYARLGKVLDDAELAELRQRIDEIMLGEIPYPEMDFQLDGEDADYAKMPTVSPGHKGSHASVPQDHGFGAGPRLSHLYAAPALPPDHSALYRRRRVDLPGDVYEQASGKGHDIALAPGCGRGLGRGLQSDDHGVDRARPSDGRKRLYADRARQPQARSDHRKALSFGRSS